MILLIGNYSLDRQQSMQRFATMMLEGLAAAGVPAELVQPQPYLGKIHWAGRFVAKWLAYIDKFILFRPRFRKKMAALRPAIVHIADHSNAMYAGWIRGDPVVVTATISSLCAALWASRQIARPLSPASGSSAGSLPDSKNRLLSSATRRPP